MKHPCEKIYAIGGENKKYGDITGVCRITGKQSTGIQFKKWVKDTFTDLAYLLPGTIISNEAAFCFDEASEQVQKQTGKDKLQRFRTSSIVEDFYEAINNKGFGIGSIMDDENLTYSDLVELLKENSNDGVQIFGSQFSGMVDFYVKWKEENEIHTEVTAWTFHDSHNFASIVLETPFGETDCEEIDEELAEKILLQYPGVPHIDGTDACEETEDFIFHFDRWATNPWICDIEIK